jgi:hypothetical protein
MNTPDNNELLMFHFGEDLGPERIAEIAAAISTDAELAKRYESLRRLLGASTSALSAAPPDADFERRLWQQLGPRIRAQSPQRNSRWLNWWLPGLALAASLGLGMVIGRQWQPVPMDPTTSMPIGSASLVSDGGDRVLAAHLARHLGQTERLLRVAENGGDDDSNALAAALIESNRLYAAAAARAGRPVLAQFLSELEPLLRELANCDGDRALGGASLAQEQIRSRDLLYRVQALEALQSSSPAPQRL